MGMHWEHADSYTVVVASCSYRLCVTVESNELLNKIPK